MTTWSTLEAKLVGSDCVGECVRGRAVGVVGGWGEQGAGYKKPARFQ
uniref:Uncharacterized protein n=1 Tax=Arundo donax TaxID=35708 RepID=A0A0A8XVP6_ARUDO